MADSKNTTKVNGICTPFTNAIFAAPGVDEQAGGGTKGGVDLPEGQSQSGAGELGTFVTTADLPQEGAATASIKGGKRPSDMAGS